MRWFRKVAPPLETFHTAAFGSAEDARQLLVARLAHRAGPAWHPRYGDPLGWLEQVYYDLEDAESRAHFARALGGLCEEPGARWAALTLIRLLRLEAAAPVLLRLADTGALRGQSEGPCADLQIYLIVALEELGLPAAIPFLNALLADATYAVSACLALLRIAPQQMIPYLPSVAAASSQATEGSSGMLGSIGSVLAMPLRAHDTDTFLAMVHALQQCERPIRVHAVDALRRQTELETRPELEAEARRLLLREIGRERS